MIRDTAGILKEWQQKGLDTIAVICRNQTSAAGVSRELSKYVAVMESNLEKALALQEELESHTAQAQNFSKGLRMVLGDQVGVGEDAN